MQGKLLYDKSKGKPNFNIKNPNSMKKIYLKFLAGTDCYKQQLPVEQ